jgi:hypothetical protein
MRTFQLMLSLSHLRRQRDPLYAAAHRIVEIYSIIYQHLTSHIPALFMHKVKMPTRVHKVSDIS